MNKPKWAKVRKYKVVSKDNLSCLKPHERWPAGGSILAYKHSSIVVSPDGIDRSSLKLCNRGIHAFATRGEADSFIYNDEKIITVWSNKWYGNSSKVRALRVWVGRKVEL